MAGLHCREAARGPWWDSLSRRGGARRAGSGGIANIIGALERGRTAKGNVTAKLDKGSHDLGAVREAVQVTAGGGHALLGKHPGGKLVRRVVLRRLIVSDVQLDGQPVLASNGQLAPKRRLLHVCRKLVVRPKVQANLAHAHTTRAGEKLVQAGKRGLVQSRRTIRMRAGHDANALDERRHIRIPCGNGRLKPMPRALLRGVRRACSTCSSIHARYAEAVGKRRGTSSTGSTGTTNSRTPASAARQMAIEGSCRVKLVR